MILNATRTSKCLLACIITILFALALSLPATQAFAVTSAEKQKEADALAARIDELSTQLNEAYEVEKEANANYEAAIAARDAALEQKADAERRIAETQERLSGRAAVMYTNGNISIIDVLLGANSFQDFLTAWDAYEFINSYDSDLIDANRQAREEAAAAAAEYEEQSRIAAEELERAKAARIEIEETTAALSDELEAMNEEIAILIAKEEEEAREEEERKRREEEARKQQALQQQQQPSYSGGEGGAVAFDSSTFAGWVKPCSYSYVSCEFGYSPITGSHNGIDLAAGTGTPIYAAGPGTVTYVGWYGTGGNSVIISHGNGVQTIYMHQSQTAASVGSYVSAGSVIGYVGSTGLSTGPHLHFQLTINGVPTNPRNYFSF